MEGLFFVLIALVLVLLAIGLIAHIINVTLPIIIVIAIGYVIYRWAKNRH
jgi:uncharacterized membrane protein